MNLRSEGVNHFTGLADIGQSGPWLRHSTPLEQGWSYVKLRTLRVLSENVLDVSRELTAGRDAPHDACTIILLRIRTCTR